MTRELRSILLQRPILDPDLSVAPSPLRMTVTAIFEALLALFPGRFATELGIDLKAGPNERQKWFLAAILYGARISGSLAARTYRVFAENGVLTPEAILAQGWDGLVALLDEGGYTRYDFKTATKLLRVMEALKRDYDGQVEQVAAKSKDYQELSARLSALAPGLGPTTVNIFLRELRGIWPQAEPPLSPLAQLSAEHLNLIPPQLNPEEALEVLSAKWQAEPLAGQDFADLEAALVRLGKDYCRKPARRCPMGRFCGRSQTLPP